MITEHGLRAKISSRWHAWAFTDVVAILIMLASLVVLAGWSLDSAPMKSIFLPIGELKPNNAVGFLAVGFSLVLLRFARNLVSARRIAQGSAIFMSLIGLFTLAEYITGLNLGIDTLFFSPPISAGTALRMAPVSAINFTLLGCALFLMSFSRAVRIGQWLAFPVLLTGFLTLVGFLYGTIMNFGDGHYTPMAMGTATLFVVSALGVFLRYPSEGVTNMMTSNTIGGWVFRRFLPVVIGTPVLIGWLQLRGELSGHYDSAFRVAIMIVVLVLILSVALCHAAKVLNRIVADRMRADLALRESEEKYRLLTDNSSSAVASHEMVFDEEGSPVDFIFLSANHAFEKQTGLRVADVIGRRVTEVLPGIGDTPFLEIYGNVVSTGQPYSFEQYAAPLGRHFYVSAYSLGQGRFAAVFTDITERKNAEAELRQRESFLNLMLETVPIPVYYKGKDRRYVLVNKAFETMFWRPKAEIIGKTVFDICPPELAKIYNDDDSMLLETPGTSAYYSHVEDTMGLVHDVIFQKASLTNPKGEVVGIIGAILNITDHKHMEEELREAKLLLEAATGRAERSPKKKT